MATLHMMVGLPGSGKTTEAKRLEKELNALRLTPDEWHIYLYGHDVDLPEHDERHDKVEKLMWDVAVKAVRAGMDAILDFGLWGRSERDEFRKKAESLGITLRFHYMDVPNDIIWARLEERNKIAGENGVFYISRKNFDEWAALFEPPTKDELE